MRLVSFIDVDGNAVVINPDHVVSLREGEIEGTVIALSNETEETSNQPLDVVVDIFLSEKS